jgi:hypothetical protein
MTSIPSCEPPAPPVPRHPPVHLMTESLFLLALLLPPRHAPVSALETTGSTREWVAAARPVQTAPAWSTADRRRPADATENSILPEEEEDEGERDDHPAFQIPPRIATSTSAGSTRDRPP